MAKVNEQNIPSELLDMYRGTLGEVRPNAAVHKRYPYRLPRCQEGGSLVTQPQKTQRERFKAAIQKFKTLSPAERARWYDAMPPWSSFLWYYNYCIMSSLMGNANTDQGGAGVIKSIQHKLIDIPAGAGEGQVALDTIDPAKSVVMLNGASTAIDEEFPDPGLAWWATMVFPYVSSLTANLLKCKWCIAIPHVEATKAATISAIIIEYI